ncbi:hypothetical protein GQ43DRAFT_187272 [Delitschia confertaspora ATCC 74209]|uniref:F-box domain-containing protein n=1 Tax=Delitschia confertaspora ATCC 74209 TaxID=1513339 RepID=A0A9P4MYH6_9PLEO|nr:hypothetical protein GQ43DRAFT_187272 [Delitschia confertaspora ATCC 74209]
MASHSALMISSILTTLTPPRSPPTAATPAALKSLSIPTALTALATPISPSSPTTLTTSTSTGTIETPITVNVSKTPTTSTVSISLGPTFLSLPLELILEITDHLPPDGVLSLKFTHSILNSMLSLHSHVFQRRFQALTKCARVAIRTYLQNPTVAHTHMRCILCKCVYPVQMFTSAASPACATMSSHADSSNLAKMVKEVVELPERFCAWHVGRLTRIVRTERGGRNEWVSEMREICIHCGAVKDWRSTPCECDCGSCGVRVVRTYTRYLDNEWECREFVFWREGQEGGKELKNDEEMGNRSNKLNTDAQERRQDNMAPESEAEPLREDKGSKNTLTKTQKAHQGQLFVRETCWPKDASSAIPSTIDLPVHLKDPEDSQM